MARNGEDLALLLDVTLDRPLVRRERAIDGARFLYLEDHPLCPVDDAVRAPIEAVVEALEAAGAAVDRRSALLPDLAEQHDTYMRMLQIALFKGAPGPQGQVASAAQLGTAFVGCPESAADAAYRAALAEGRPTVMTRAISGRPARGRQPPPPGAKLRPDRSGYPIAYDAGKALNAAAKARGEAGFGAQWAGQGPPSPGSCRRARWCARWPGLR
jgi:Asp-tRNA(Asn)/Glu-tRNA(Gln) amidotransferase A subunit family amidase